MDPLRSVGDRRGAAAAPLFARKRLRSASECRANPKGYRDGKDTYDRQRFSDRGRVCKSRRFGGLSARSVGKRQPFPGRSRRCRCMVCAIAGMLLYGLIFGLRIKKPVAPSIPCEETIRLCDSIDTPFLFGVFRPRIYLLSDMTESEMPYVLAYEKAHLRRSDHLWKPLGFLLLTVYWFSPILWAAYALLCRDIEKACDEKLILEMDDADKKGYSEALVSRSIHRR